MEDCKDSSSPSAVSAQQDPEGIIGQTIKWSDQWTLIRLRPIKANEAHPVTRSSEGLSMLSGFVKIIRVPAETLMEDWKDSSSPSAVSAQQDPEDADIIGPTIKW